jgi:HD-GYP domain-containing protein (c-di-GMP phosphodiesterase class II)
MNRSQVVSILSEGAGKQWDGECVRAFLDALDGLVEE